MHAKYTYVLGIRVKLGENNANHTEYCVIRSLKGLDVVWTPKRQDCSAISREKNEMVDNTNRAKEQLLYELETQRQRIAELEIRCDKKERQLKEVQRKHSQLLDNLTDIIYALDCEGYTIYINSAVETLLGYTAQKMIGKHYSEWLDKDEPVMTEKASEKGLKGQTPSGQATATVTDSNGIPHTIELKETPVFKDDQVIAIHGIARDITLEETQRSQLQESEKRFRDIFEKTPDGMLVADVQTRRFYMANPAICQMLGYTEAETIQRGLRDIHPEEDLPHVLKEFGLQAKGLKRLARELPVKRKNGSVFYADINAILMTLEGRRFVLGIFRDVTELRQAHMTLQESEMRYRRILASIDSGVSVYEVVDDGNDVLFEDINTAGERIGQVKKQDIVGQSLLSVFPGAQEDGAFEVIRDVWRTGQPRTMPAHLYDDGRIAVWVDSHLFKLPSGEIVHVTNDVTKYRQAQEALVESEENYRVLVESASEAITVFDAHGIIKFANARVSDHFGVDPSELVGKTMWDLFPESVAGCQMDHVKQIIETAVGTTVVHSIKMWGQEKWFEATLVPMRRFGGKVLDVMMIARDITELKKARDELRTFHRQMMQTERLASTGTLSAMVAHELNQPLTVIKLSVQNVLSALHANRPSDTLFEDLNECLRGVENAAERVDQFRCFASGTLKTKKVLVALRPLIDMTLRLVEESCKQARLSIAVEGFEGLPPLQACQQDLEQLFFILIENSIQASDGKTEHHLTITGHFRANCIEIRLADDCGGIAHEHMDQIFKLFFSVKPHHQGTGLGLCIAERIVTQMDGKITVNNDPGQGVAFCVSLPIQSD